jgi:TonB-linked SusC/RagA family outer membrane protein
MKKLSLLLFLLFASLSIVVAQRTVTGVIKDQGGLALIGANVLVKGTTVGTITDIDGSFSLSVPEDAEMLEVTYTGFTDQMIPLVAGQSEYMITLAEGAVLNEVVVTAQGIERERKELGYSVTTVDGDEVGKVRSANVLDNLSGRVAGVRINSASGTAGGGSTILIRGAASLGGGNQPLFVVDGAPISNSSFNGSRNQIIGGGADVGNRASDLNADDIESISVLKGASAVALYGQRAKDGVILVTTKRAKADRTTIEVNSSLRTSSPFILPEFQNEYAAGDFGNYDANNVNGWGPNIADFNDEVSVFPYRGATGRLQAQPDNVKDFFRNGLTRINNVSVASRSGSSDIRLSYTNFNEEGIVPGNEVRRNNLSLNAGTNFSEKFRARGTANYVRTEGLNRPRQGSNNPNRVVANIYGIQRTVSVDDLANNVLDSNGDAIGLDETNQANNPFYIVENNPFNNQVDRLFGTAVLEYDVAKGLKLMARAGTDFFTEERRNISSKGTLNQLQGQFEDRSIYRRENNLDLIATYETKITDDIGLKALGGWNVNEINGRNTRLLANDLVVPNVYNPGNASSVASERFESIRRLLGGYVDLGFSFKDYLFVNVTGRNDWSSTLPVENNSYFYPGVSASFILTDALEMDNKTLSFAKLRASYASVGSDEAPYQLDFLYSPASSIFTQFVPDNTFPWNGQSVFFGPNTLPAGNSLLPQNQATFEVGTELQFFNGRVGLDLTYYSIVTSDQILSVSVAQSTGFEAIRQNVGEVSNKGVEVLLSLNPVRTNNFSWDVDFNFTSNQQVVESLAEGLDELALTSGFSGLSLRAVPGEEYGLYGAGWARDPDGNIIINQETGLRQTGERERLGDIFPDYTLGINNNFSLGNFNVSALVDISQGGVMFSGTVAGLRSSGLAIETLDREVFVDEGVAEITDADGNVTYEPNTVPVQSVQDYWGTIGNTSNTEGSIFDASYVKLREITVSYALPAKYLGSGFVKGVSIGLEGRNLWLIDSAVPHVDPESSFFGPSLQGGAANVEFWSVPSARSFGGNVKLTF